jgi:spore maturation protein CgeB
VVAYEPSDGWSRTNLLQDHGLSALSEGLRVVPGVKIRTYDLDRLDLDRALDHAEVVLVHEWTDPLLVARIGRYRNRGGHFLLFFHDTHHRAVTAPQEIDRFDLDGYDAVLAFGEVLREIYQYNGWGRRAFTWHEAADSALFRPILPLEKNSDLVWIGNWGDGERDNELREFLLAPAARFGIKGIVHGVRYPDGLRAELAMAGLQYSGWLANQLVPNAFARARITLHIPRQPYVAALAGIPTIRVFEALACGIPLVCAPWNDVEGLFPPGCYTNAKNADEVVAAFSLLLRDQALADHLASTGLNAVRSRHTCSHRVEELHEIIRRLGPAVTGETATQRRHEAIQ